MSRTDPRAKKPDPKIAEAALREAEERRAAQARMDEGPFRESETELNGRKGPDPVRFGDWENKGIASDF